MANIVRRPEWFLPEGVVTPESHFSNRRSFLRLMGFSGAGLMASNPGSWAAEAATAPKKGYPFARNSGFNPEVRLTEEAVAGSYNNFYEFSLDKEEVRVLTSKFITSPWPIEIQGLCEHPFTLDVEELVSQMPMEERVCRFRCVEAWAMIVPWTGFPLAKLIEKARPKPEAKFIRFVTAHRPEQFPGVVSPRTSKYPWPYFEGLRLDEAMNPLTLVATGIYGKPLPKQHGAPLRIVVPWKYGYKSIKSVVRLEFVAEQPKTFWETLSAEEYPFESNVNPKIPHPRWSQATERMIGTGDRVRTLPFNGYGAQVAKLYS